MFSSKLESSDFFKKLFSFSAEFSSLTLFELFFSCFLSLLIIVIHYCMESCRKLGFSSV